MEEQGSMSHSPLAGYSSCDLKPLTTCHLVEIPLCSMEAYSQAFEDETWGIIPDPNTSIPFPHQLFPFVSSFLHPRLPVWYTIITLIDYSREGSTQEGLCQSTRKSVDYITSESFPRKWQRLLLPVLFSKTHSLAYILSSNLTFSRILSIDWIINNFSNLIF